MSQWTHVSGIIRVDSFGALHGVDVESDLKTIMGDVVTYDELTKPIMIDANMPCGSEGTLRYTVTRTFSEYPLIWGHVAIWGDLRDYDDVDEITRWLNDVLVAIVAAQLMIRDCIMRIDVEGQESTILTWHYFSDGSGKLHITKAASHIVLENE